MALWIFCLTLSSLVTAGLLPRARPPVLNLPTHDKYADRRGWVVVRSHCRDLAKLVKLYGIHSRDVRRKSEAMDARK